MATVTFLRWTLQQYTKLALRDLEDTGDEPDDVGDIEKNLTLLNQGTLEASRELLTLQQTLEEIIGLSWTDTVEFDETSEELVSDMAIELDEFAGGHDDPVLENIRTSIEASQDSDTVLLHLLLFVLYLKDHDL